LWRRSCGTQSTSAGGANVPPEFVPSERRKRRETPPPKEPQSVDDLVNDIMRKYREEQQRLGNVDNWGQPNEKLDRKKVEKWVEEQLKKQNDNEKKVGRKGEKRFSPKAAAESLSEAIGNRFRERQQRQKENREPSSRTSNPKASRERETRTPNKNRESKRAQLKKPINEKLAANLGRSIENKKLSERNQDSRISPRLPRLDHSQGGEAKEIGKNETSTHFQKFKDNQRTETNQEKERKTGNPKDDFNIGNLHEVKTATPEIHGVRITSEEQLRSYINNELPGLKSYPKFDKILDDAVAHIRLRQLIGDRTSLTFPEIRDLSEQIGVPLRTTRTWVTEYRLPELYRLAESAVTKTEAKVILEKVRLNRNGIHSIQDINHRLNASYFDRHIRQLKSFSRDLEMSKKYFKFLELLAEGGIIADIARRAGISRLTGLNYTNGIHPHLIRRVKDFPSEEPTMGWKWLPLRIGNSQQFIEVPLKVTKWNEVQKVLDQVESLSGPQMNRWKLKYGPLSKEEALMYSLGAIISDGSLSVSRMSSRMKIALSKKYEWSPNFGEVVCYCLGVLGIHAERNKDIAAPNNVINERGKKRRISGPGFYTWESEQHLLLRWMRESCLGLGDSQNKIKFPIDGKWALTAPIGLRREILRGIADGDGYVSVNSQYVGIATKVNQPFYGRLLKSLGAESIPTSKDVLIKQSSSILKITEQQLFKYAESRQESLEELRSLVSARKAKPVGSRLSKEEIDFAVMLRRNHKSYGAITRSVFKRFGNSWDISTIEHAIKRRQRNTTKK
jgi:hypothetical protein